MHRGVDHSRGRLRKREEDGSAENGRSKQTDLSRLPPSPRFVFSRFLLQKVFAEEQDSAAHPIPIT